MLKEQIILCMTPEVKDLIQRRGITPEEIATEFILRKFAQIDNIAPSAKGNSNSNHRMLYQDLQFDESGTSIIDIRF